MASITTMGMGSGLDIGGLVSQLVAAEGAPTSQRLDRQERQAAATLSALGTLKSGLASLRAGAEKLAEAATADADAYAASSSEEEILSASAGDDATAGSYQVEVLRLAQRHKLGSDSFEGTQTFGGTAGDQLVLSAGEESMTLDMSTGRTLAEIRDAINDDPDNPGIGASIIRVDEAHEVLTLTASEPGSEQAISLSEALASGPSLALDTLNFDSGGERVSDLTALDAAVRIDGVEVTRSTNQLTDVVDGLSLALGKAEPGALIEVAVEPDHEPLTAAIKDFVGKYNAFTAAVTTYSGYRGEGADQPALFGDSLPRSLANLMRVELGRSISGLDGSFSALTEIGITTGADGRLSLDEAELSSAIETDAAGVAALFVGDEGIAAGIDAVSGRYLDSGGVFETRSDGLERRLDRIGDAREALDRRLEGLELRYRQQFSAMDALVGQLTTTSDFLTQQFAALNNKAG